VRQAEHRKIAEVLSASFPQIVANQPEILAHHFDEAALAEPAVGYWLSASQKSIARYANVEASRQLRRGLEALMRLPESIERDQRELFLLTMRGFTLITVSGYAAPEVEQTFARARALCQKLGDTPHLFPVLFGLCLFYMVRADAEHAFELAGQLESIAAATKDVELELEMHGAKASILFWAGRFQEAHEHILRARASFDPAKHGHHAFVYGQEPLSYGYAYGAIALWFLGYPEQAVLSAEKAVELASRSGHPLTLAGTLSFSADLHFHLRNVAEFARLAERTIEVAVEHNLQMWIGSGRTMRGWARFAQGDLEEGINEIRAGLDFFRKTGADVNSGYFISRLARAYLVAGRIDEGLATIDEAVAHVEKFALDRYYDAEIHRLKGELLQRQPTPDRSGAIACFERSLSIARSQGARAIELRAAMNLGVCWHADGGTERARGLLGDVYGWFTEGFETSDLREAKALLDAWK
jgi:predicted ATPase